MKKKYEAPAVEVLEMGVTCLLEESPRVNINDDYLAPGEAW